MARYIDRILSVSKSGLSAQQAIIANTSNNIANVNTPGYVRRRVELATRPTHDSGGVLLGNGVDVGSITRIANDFLDKAVNSAVSEFEAIKVQDDFLKRIESLFSLESNALTIGTSMNEFFHAINDLSANPASIELRANVIARGEELAESIRNTFSGIAALQKEADQQIVTELNTVNAITRDIANLNLAIAEKETLGGVAADERDQRYQLLRKLSEKLEYQMLETPDGMVNITLSNGFSLVNGTRSTSIQTEKLPSFAAPPPPSLSGDTLNYIVYDFSGGAGTGHINLTDIIASGGGSISGLLQIRGTNDPANTSAFQGTGTLVEVAGRVEDFTRSLLITMNTLNLGPDVPAGGPFNASARDLNNAAPPVFGLFDITGGIADGGNGLPDTADLIANGRDNFSSVLQFAVTDPRAIAAAQDDGTGFFQGDNRNLVALRAQQETALTGSVTGNTGTFQELYDQTVGEVGNKRNSTRVRADVAENNLLSAEESRDSLSSVSLEEEFSDLVKFQKAFEAAARLIKVADEMLQQVVNLI